MSETYYLKDVSHIPALTTKYLDETKKVCDLKTIGNAQMFIMPVMVTISNVLLPWFIKRKTFFLSVA